MQQQGQVAGQGQSVLAVGSDDRLSAGQQGHMVKWWTLGKSKWAGLTCIGWQGTEGGLVAAMIDSSHLGLGTLISLVLAPGLFFSYRNFQTVDQLLCTHTAL
jgi:hypothetical protein